MVLQYLPFADCLPVCSAGRSVVVLLSYCVLLLCCPAGVLLLSYFCLPVVLLLSYGCLTVVARQAMAKLRNVHQTMLEAQLEKLEGTRACASNLAVVLL